MKTQYELTLDDYVEANKLYSKSKPIEYYGVQIFGWLCLAVGVASVALKITIDAPGYMFMIPATLYGAYIVLASTVFSRYIHSRRLKNYPSFFQPVILEVTATQMNFQTPDSATQVAWSKFVLFRESRNLFILFWSPKVFQIVPKRAFANAADLEQFRAWASGIGQKDAPPIAPIPQP